MEDAEELFLDFRLTVSAIQHCQVRSKIAHVYSDILPDPVHPTGEYTFISLNEMFILLVNLDYVLMWSGWVQGNSSGPLVPMVRLVPTKNDVIPKTKHLSQTKHSKAKHPKLETTVGWITTILRLAWRNPNQVEAADAFAPPKVDKIHPKVL